MALILVACTRATPTIVSTWQGTERRYPMDASGLVTAASWGDQSAVELFHQKGFKMDAADAEGNTALHAAADKRDYLMVKALLGYGLDPNQQNQAGYTPLMLAVANQDRGLTLALLEAGADPALKNKAGQTASDIAESRGNLELVELLLPHGMT